MHHFLNMYLREGDLINNCIRDTMWFAIIQHWPDHTNSGAYSRHIGYKLHDYMHTSNTW